MKKNNDYKFDSNNLSLVRFDMDVKTADIVEIILDNLTKEEMDMVMYLTYNTPFISSTEDDESYWDIIFLDCEVKNCIETILKKYNVEYICQDITNLYDEKSEQLDIDFVKEIDDFLDKHLDVDTILDKITDKGIESLKKYELNFLERQSAK